MDTTTTTPEVEAAVAMLEGLGYRVRAPRPARQPRAEREYASISDLKKWADGALKKLGKQNAVATAAGLPGGYGPIHAALAGRPLSKERFVAWQESYAAHIAAQAPTPAAKAARKARPLSVVQEPVQIAALVAPGSAKG